jgi:hypothetical protein
MRGQRCPSCGAEVALDSNRCWLCGQQQPVWAEIVEDSQPAQQRLAWMIHATAWLAVVLALSITGALIYQEEPAFAVGFAILAVPTIAFTMGGAALARGTGRPWHPLIKLLIGLGIAGVLLPVAAVVALFVLCFSKL